MPRTTKIIKAVRDLQMRRPEYFGKNTNRVTKFSGTLPRPNLLSNTKFFDGERILDKVLPSEMWETKPSVWHDRFLEVLDDCDGVSPFMLEVLAEDLVARCGMFKHYKPWFIPDKALEVGAGIPALLCLCLSGAMLSGAEVIKLDYDSFVVADNDEPWGVQHNKVIGSDVQLTVVSYKRIVEGTYWRGGSCNSRPFCAAFRAAMRAEDKVAAETLLCAYWATRSTKRLDSVLKIKTREELWRI